MTKHEYARMDDERTVCMMRDLSITALRKELKTYLDFIHRYGRILMVGVANLPLYKVLY